MNLIGFFVRYIFSFVFLPLFFIFLIGKPLFLIKILNDILHKKVNNTQIFHFLLVLFIIFDVYYYYSFTSGNKLVQRMIKKDYINPEDYSIRLSQTHSDERNIYIFLTCIAMLLIIHKFGERHIRNAQFEFEKKELEKKLGISGDGETPSHIKKD